MTQAQRNAIPTPAEGLIVYCTDCSPVGLMVYSGAVWRETTGSILIANNLTETVSGKALDASQGKILKGLVDLKENTITTGTTAQYWRGDKTWQTLDKSALGLGNVDNTSDANNPVSTAQQAALDTKENTANKTAGTLETNKLSDVKFPTVKAVYDWAKGLFAPLISPSFTGNVSASGQLRSEMSSGAEGGELFLTKSATGSTLAVGISLDVYENKLRIFESGGAYRGAYLDVSALEAGIATSLDPNAKVEPLLAGQTIEHQHFPNFQIIASSEYPSDLYKAWRALNYGSFWATNSVTTNYWWRIDFIYARPLVKRFFYVGRAGEYPATGTYQVSDDGATWTDVGSFTGGVGGGAWVTHVMSSPKRGRYFRILVLTSNASAVAPGFGQVGVWGAW
jgi:hypothetical protein